MSWREVQEGGRRRNRWNGNGSVRGWRKKKEEENNKDKLILNSSIIFILLKHWFKPLTAPYYNLFSCEFNMINPKKELVCLEGEDGIMCVDINIMV